MRRRHQSTFQGSGGHETSTSINISVNVGKVVEVGKSLRLGNNKTFQVETIREDVVNESAKKQESESG
ncbi:unnamed protein product, partial [Timema podura]|nr:unnamed protein product [Timema podura]